MPRIGNARLLGSVATILAACLICAGCTMDREFGQPEAEWTAVPGTPDMNPDRTTQVAELRVARADAEVVVPPAHAGPPLVIDRPLPRELEKVNHPTYIIEPPDILLIDAARLV